MYLSWVYNELLVFKLLIFNGLVLGLEILFKVQFVAYMVKK